MKVVKTLSENYDLKGLKGKLLLCDPASVPLTPSELYIRSGIDRDWVMRLEVLIEEGADLDPVVVAYVKDLGKEVLVGGNHRVEAYRGLMEPEIKVLHIGEISLEEFFKLQRELNPDILPMDTEELKRYAEKLYDHLKSKYEKKELYEKIADAVGRSPETVRKWLAGKEQEEKREKIRRAIELKEKGYTQEQIAKELGVPRRTVAGWLAKMGELTKSAKTPLLTPTGDPTPEGLKLWGEFVLEAQKLGDIFNDSAFYTFAQKKGYQVEMHGMFLAEIRERVYSYINNLVSSGLKLRQIQEAMVYEREGVFEHLSTPVKKKLALLLKNYIENKIEEKKRLTELELKSLEVAKEIVQDPEYVFSNWIDLAMKVRGKLGEDLPTRGSARTQEIADILKKHHSDTLMELYNQIPEVPEEKVKEILEDHDLEEFESLEQLIATVKASVLQEGYRWTRKAELIIIEAYREFEKASLHSPSDSPTTASAGSGPALSEEDPYADREAILKKAEEAWERMHAQEELPMEKENKGKRGRPPKEKFFDKDRELEDLKNQMREALWLIVNKFGWEAAAKVLDEVVEEFREDTPAEVWS